MYMGSNVAKIRFYQLIKRLFQKVFFHKKCLFYVKFNGDFKYVDDLEYKLNLTYLQLGLVNDDQKSQIYYFGYF